MGKELGEAERTVDCGAGVTLWRREIKKEVSMLRVLNCSTVQIEFSKANGEPTSQTPPLEESPIS